MAWISALPLTQLQANIQHKIIIKDEVILLLLHKDSVHAIAARCHHLKLPLAKGKLSDACVIICPFHKSEFDIKTGKVLRWSPWPPVVGKLLGKISKEKPLKIYPTNVEDGMVLVDF